MKYRMSEEAYIVHEWPDVVDPILVVALEGWIDASGAAMGALNILGSKLNARPVATFDADQFLDFRARRPTMQLRDGVNIGLVWPDTQLKVGRSSGGRDVLLLTGHEPDMRWRAFCEAVVHIATTLGVARTIGFGAYPIAVPHSRPSRLSVSCSSPDILAHLPYQRNSVDVPAGAGAALEQALGDAGIESFTLWAQIPHYLAANPYPAGSLALLTGLAQTTGIEVDANELADEAVIVRTRVDELVKGNPEHLSMLAQLEEAWDGATQTEPVTSIDTAELPSGDELAAELEKYLRDHGA